MLTWFSKRSRSVRKATQLYGAVVAQARQPEFYSVSGIPDTAEGRYELIILNLFLLLDRLRGAGVAAADVSRALIEAFVTDMDDNMREMGVGDLSVGRKVKRAAAGFYERAAAYQDALAGTDEDLRRVMESVFGAPAATTLAAYARAASRQLYNQSFDDVVQVGPAYPAFASVLNGEPHGGLR